MRRHYEDEIRRLRWDLFRSAPGKGRPDAAAAASRRPAKTSALARGGPDRRRPLRETMILAILAVTPAVMDDFAADLEGLAFTDPDRAANGA